MSLFTDKPTLSRRVFMRVGLTSFSGYCLTPMLMPVNAHAETPGKLRGEADACIFLFLRGGASQLDTFDLKEGHWTPPEFDARKIKGINIPYGLFPKISDQLDDIVIARSVEAWESAHPRAVYYMQVGHAFSAAREKEMPSVGAVVSYEFLNKRKSSDYLPPYVALNFSNGSNGYLVEGGCLPQQAHPLSLATGTDLPFVVDPKEKETFDRRWKMLRELSGQQGVQASKTAEQWASYYDSAFKVMSSPEISKVLKIGPEDHQRYGASSLGDACVLARNLLDANAGTRYITICHNGWDFHSNIFDKSQKSNHFTLCKELDQAFPALIEDLKKLKTPSGKSLFERTFLVCTGEFGRTGGDLTVNKGRDHNRGAQSVLFAGAGVKGGRAFGATDDQGWKVVKPEWEKKRSIYTEDILATIYSQLGIDWNKEITNTPSGRAFAYLDVAGSTDFVDVGEIPTLFA
ncbi:MAG TPA: DUF1501 domain-containing protein [Bryobacteraceae bacterium]|nr:DUF1501 domain-containing protein [Bryobacteraceae bacterium]